MPTESQNDKNNPEGGGNQNPPEEPLKFEAWLEKQDEAIKKAYGEHILGLKNTVKATRDERDEFKRQLGEAAKNAEKGSQLENTLTDTLAKLEAADKKADFLEGAIQPEIGCRNPKAAFAVALADNLFDKRTGAPDWNAIKKAAPELFGQKLPKGSAGSGTDETPPKTQDMNTMIRRAAGQNVE